MLTLKYITENTDDVITRLAKKHFDGTAIIAEVVELDNLRKATQVQADTAAAELNNLSKERYIQPFFHAVIHSGLGENDTAFEYLEKAYGERDSLLPFMKLWLYFDNLRSDPRYDTLLKKIGLPTD